MKHFIKIVTALAVSIVISGGAWAQPKEITVAYFLEWPSPNLLYKDDSRFEKEMGVKVNWRAFGNGNEMSAAMASGDVHIAYSQGLVPFVVAVTKGLPIKLVSIAIAYSEGDNCIVHKDAGITQANARDLEGKKVASPIGNVTHYKYLRVLQHLKVDADKVKLVQMNPAEGAAALARGDVAMACGFGGGLQRMRNYGKPLMTATEQEAIGIGVYDIVSATEQFANKHPDYLVKFLQLTEDINNAFRKNPEKYLAGIAKQSGQKLEDTRSAINQFTFPTRDEQLSSAWMGGAVKKFINEIAQFYVDTGTIESKLDDYGSTINTKFMKRVR